MTLLRSRQGLLAVFTLLLLCLPVSGASLQAKPPALPEGVERVTSVEGITEYRLKNGLRVLLFPDPSKQTITVNVTYLVGSKHENYGETGMAHLLEHLLFKGSKNHPDISKELTERGADANGTTWTDRTNYYETIPATDANLEWALRLEADRMVNSFIAKKDLDSEMTVVRNEFELGENSPSNVLSERMASTAFLWHNYGKSTIGARSDIEKVPIERLQAFYRKYYQPDNAVLLVAGKFDEPKTLSLISTIFGAIERPSRVLSKVYTEEPVQDGERSVTLRRVGDVQLVAAAYHVPAGSHTDFAALSVLVEILGDTPSGRLHRALVETKKASSIGAVAYQFGEPTLAFFEAEVRQDSSLEAARDALLEVVERFTATPPTKEEVERARTQLLKDIELNLNASDRIGVELSEWIGMGDWRLLFLHRDRLRKVTAEEVQRVAASYLKSSNRTLGLFIPTAKPDRAEIPATPDVAALVKDYKGDAVIAAGEAFDPSPSNIESRTVRADAGGVKLALLPKKTRGSTVVAVMTLRFGDEKSLMNRATHASLAAQMLMRGTKNRTRQQIKDELDRLKARVLVAGGATGVNASIETVRENLPAVLRLLAEVLREPSFPATEFEQLKQELLAQLEAQRSEPQAIGFIEFNRHLHPYPKGDVRYTATPDEEIAEVKSATLEEARKFYEEFYGASNGELAVVGDFDPKEVERLTAELLGSWKSPRPFARVASPYRDITAINKAIETPDKPNALLVAGVRLNLRDDDPDYPAMVLADYLMGGGFLNSRLASRIRQKEGLSYGVGSYLEVSAVDRNGQFVAGAIYAPENGARLEAAFKEEIERALKDGFTPEEVVAARAGFLQGRQVARAQDAELARKLATYRFIDRTLAWDADLEKKINELTPDQVVAAMRRHIDPAKVSIVKAGNFNGK
ncbi:MAG TPA: pitrilysin family protein [Blastocatellia bacterium]|nr:pitrilysin family protein [Blastocatellia bacterium]